MVMKLVFTQDGKPVEVLTKTFDSGHDLHAFLAAKGLTINILDCIDDVETREMVTYTLPTKEFING